MSKKITQKKQQIFTLILRNVMLLLSMSTQFINTLFH